MKNLSLILLISLFSTPLFSQESSYINYIKGYSPLSPNAASLGKYGAVPVSLYTVIGYPLNTCAHRSLKGIASIMDSNKFTAYHGYDGFGRLALIKDMEGDIIKGSK